jgi:hypothetical protein
MIESRSKRQMRDISSATQRARLLERLQLGPVDTLTARQELNVLHPAARIQELRAAGYPIQTHRQTLEDEHGFKHPAVAVYILSTTSPSMRVAA